MAPRLLLHDLLIGITENVYFQPPNNIKMKYPCIVYSLSSDYSAFGDDRLYVFYKRYQVKVIVQNPDSDLPDKVVELPLCRFDRWYAADNLNHYVYNLYF